MLINEVICYAPTDVLVGPDGVTLTIKNLWPEDISQLLGKGWTQVEELEEIRRLMPNEEADFIVIPSNVRKGVKGIWAHVCEGTTDLSAFMAIKGEVCVSLPEDHHLGAHAGRMILLLEGEVSYLWPFDCWSRIAPNGMRYSTGRRGSDRAEGWIVPSNARLAGVILLQEKWHSGRVFGQPVEPMVPPGIPVIWATAGHFGKKRPAWLCPPREEENPLVVLDSLGVRPQRRQIRQKVYRYPVEWYRHEAIRWKEVPEGKPGYSAELNAQQHHALEHEGWIVEREIPPED